MTRPPSASAPDDLFEAIATLLEPWWRKPGQREYFYQRMLYFRHLRPEDELLRLVEAIGLLALLIREAPHAVAREREQMARLLETSLATMQAVGEAGHAYQQQLDGRLTSLPTELAQGLSPDAIARAITESLRSAVRAHRIAGDSRRAHRHLAAIDRGDRRLSPIGQPAVRLC